VARIDSQGVPLAEFAGDGVAEVDHGASDEGGVLAVDGFGRLVVANGNGTPPDAAFIATRLSSSGMPDESFGNPTIDPTPGRIDRPESALGLPDGSILLAGVGYVETEGKLLQAGRLALVRLRPDGSPDPDFGSGGLVVHTGPVGAAYAIASSLDAAGRLLVTGSAYQFPTSPEPPPDLLIARFKLVDDPPVAGKPSNRFRFGRLKLNKRKGTATLFVRVPGPGRLVLSKTQKLKGAKKRAKKAGNVRLPIRPRGKAKRRLAARAAGKGVGRLKVKIRVTFTPDGGSPLTKQKRVRLVKR
jgi:hypothetical protein